MIKELVIGMMVFATVVIVMMYSASDVVNSVPESTPISSAYIGQEYQSGEVNEMMTDVSQNAPGGNGSQYNPGSSSFVDYSQGFRSGSIIFRSGEIFKSMLFGGGNTTENSTNIATQFSIRSEFLYLAAGCVTFLIALVLISSILFNPIK